MPSTVLAQQAVTVPSNATGSRPSASAGVLHHNSTVNALENYTASSWIPHGYPGSSAENPASSAVQIWNAGVRGKGFFWLSSPNGGTTLNFCDLDTQDENGVAGWILVAQFGSSSQWRNNGYSTRSPLDPFSYRLNENGQNDQYTRQWSANWGDYTMNRFRVQFGDSVNASGSASACDWYYHYSTACYWKQVWSWQAGANNNYINDTSGSNSGNINAFPGWPTPNHNGSAITRVCLRGFNWAYNMKFGYQVAQRWNNLSDSSGGGTAQSFADFWTILTTPTYNGTQMGHTGDDGSLAILAAGSTWNVCGQDCDAGHNAKVGYDDTGEWASWNSSSGATTTSIPSRRYKLFFWIK